MSEQEPIVISSGEESVAVAAAAAPAPPVPAPPVAPAPSAAPATPAVPAVPAAAPPSPNTSQEEAEEAFEGRVIIDRGTKEERLRRKRSRCITRRNGAVGSIWEGLSKSDYRRMERRTIKARMNARLERRERKILAGEAVGRKAADLIDFGREEEAPPPYELGEGERETRGWSEEDEARGARRGNSGAWVEELMDLEVDSDESSTEESDSEDDWEVDHPDYRPKGDGEDGNGGGRGGCGVGQMVSVA